MRKEIENLVQKYEKQNDNYTKLIGQYIDLIHKEDHCQIGEMNKGMYQMAIKVIESQFFKGQMILDDLKQILQNEENRRMNVHTDL